MEILNGEKSNQAGAEHVFTGAYLAAGSENARTSIMLSCFLPDRDSSAFASFPVMLTIIQITIVASLLRLSLGGSKYGSEAEAANGKETVRQGPMKLKIKT